MPYCRECGAQLTEQAKFCAKCGVPTGNINQEEQSQSQQNQEQSSQAQQGQQPQQPQQPVVQYVKPKIPGRGFGIASMVLGIIGLVYSISSLDTATEIANNFGNDYFGMYYDIAFNIGAIIGILIFSVLSILALIFSGSARKRGYRNGVSTSGLVMGIIGVIFYFISVMILIVG